MSELAIGRVSSKQLPSLLALGTVLIVICGMMAVSQHRRSTFNNDMVVAIRNVCALAVYLTDPR